MQSYPSSSNAPQYLVQIADDITGVQILPLGIELSPAMRQLADRLLSLGDPDLPFPIAYRQVVDACGDAHAAGLDIVAGRVPDSRTLILIFTPKSRPASVATISG